MKSIVSFDKEIGGDGAKVVGGLGVSGDQLTAEVKVQYPIAKVIEPATKAVDGLLDKLKKAIPGSWDDALIDKLKGEYKEELVKLLSEAPAAPAIPAPKPEPESPA